MNPMAVVLWLFSAAVTFGFGWLLVRFLPMWASIPLIAIIALGMTGFGALCVVGMLPGDAERTKGTRAYYSVMLTLATVTPTAIVIFLYRWV